MLEKNNIYFGDCLEWMTQIDDNMIDCIICDLPYNMTKLSWDCVIPYDKLWEEYNRIIKKNGNIVLFSSGLFTYKLIESNIQTNEIL